MWSIKKQTSKFINDKCTNKNNNKNSVCVHLIENVCTIVFLDFLPRFNLEELKIRSISPKSLGPK